MAHVITSQPTSKSMEYTAVVPDIVDGGLDTENMTIQDAENEEENKKKERASEDCCCLIQETDPLYDYWCIRSLADLFVGCGACTESTCERCCFSLCDSGDSSRNHRHCEGCDSCCDCMCCQENCCEGDCGCCDGECGCCDGGCGDCECNCGDCDCGSCDCNF